MSARNRTFTVTPFSYRLNAERTAGTHPDLGFRVGDGASRAVVVCRLGAADPDCIVAA
jgi:hypothetical protein